MKLYIGIDGGGTKTRALAVSEDGICKGTALTGASNPNSVGADAAYKNLIQAVTDAAKSAGVSPEFEAGFFGISGINDKLTASEFRKNLLNDGSAKFNNLLVDNDTRTLCAAAFGLSSGIVLIAGTGSKCYGRTEDGREWETGGYDFHVSDEASAFDLARRALVAAVRSADGRGEKTILEETLFKELQITEVGQISQRLHQDSLKNPGKPMTKDEIAALAVFVDRAFLAGDKVAKQILESALGDLVTMVATVARKLEIDPSKLELGITGGVILHNPCATLFREALERVFPKCRIFEPTLPPVVGAVIRALALGGIKVSPDVMENLKTSFTEKQ